MQYEDNGHRRPFYGWIMLYRYFQRRRQHHRTVRELQRLSNDTLKDIGLTRYDLSSWD